MGECNIENKEMILGYRIERAGCKGGLKEAELRGKNKVNWWED